MPKKNTKEINLVSDTVAVPVIKNGSTEKAKEPEKFDIVFSWKTVDFIKNSHTKFSLSIAIVGSMGMIVWGITTGSLTVVFTFIMIAIVSAMVLSEESQEVEVKIDENGINLNSEHFDFKDFISFKIIEMHGLPVLSLARKEKYFPAKAIYIQEEPVGDLRDFLEIYLPEEE